MVSDMIGWPQLSETENSPTGGKTSSTEAQVHHDETQMQQRHAMKKKKNLPAWFGGEA